MDIAKQYFNAWNDRDPGAIVELFAENGTYSDPSAGNNLKGNKIGEYAKGLFTAFPDLSFEVCECLDAGDGLIAAEWIMRGTNTGPLQDMPPTNNSVELPGADFIKIKDEKITSLKGYFDGKETALQLGLQVLVMPYSAGPFSFGNSTYVKSDNLTKPGAFSITWLDVNSPEEIDEIRNFSRPLMNDMKNMDGFIGAMTAANDNRVFTITAWEDVEDTKQVLRNEYHREAMQRFYSDLSKGGAISIYRPEYIGPLLMRCNACQKITDYEKHDGKCECGGVLNKPHSYW